MFDIICLMCNVCFMKHKWLERMTSEDQAFLKRFVLASGSLKALAKVYGVSYPTIRLRVDRLIQKIEIYDSEEPMSEFERQLRAAHADGAIDVKTLERLLTAYKKDRSDDADDSSHFAVIGDDDVG